MKKIRLPGIVACLITIGLTIPVLWFFGWGFRNFECYVGLAWLIIISLLDLFLIIVVVRNILQRRMNQKETVITSEDVHKESNNM